MIKRKFTLKTLTPARLIRLAELAIAGKIEKPYVYFDRDYELYYVFIQNPDALKPAEIDDEYIKKYGVDHVKSRHDWLEIDSSFNIELKYGHICNMANIYQLLFFWGLEAEITRTGLFPKSGREPKDLNELEKLPSEIL